MIVPISKWWHRHTHCQLAHYLVAAVVVFFNSCHYIIMKGKVSIPEIRVVWNFWEFIQGGEGVERGNIKKYVSLFFYYTGRNTRNHEGLDDDVVTFILFFFLRLSYHLLMLVMTLVTAYKLVSKKLLHVALVSTYLK